jgi:hypothetical protein
MSSEQMNDMSTEQEGKGAGYHLEAIYWGGVIIWAGLIFGADTLGYLPEIGGGDAWSWIFLGAGLYSLLMALWRVASPDYSNPTSSDYVWAGVLIILGLGGFFNFSIPWWVFLVLIGLGILGKALWRPR